MNDLIKNYINTGKSPNDVLKEKIKANNHTWFLITLLFATIWIGYICILQNRYKQAIESHSQCDSIHKVDKLTIEMQYKTLDSAVFVKDIK